MCSTSRRSRPEEGSNSGAEWACWPQVHNASSEGTSPGNLGHAYTSPNGRATRRGQDITNWIRSPDSQVGREDPNSRRSRQPWSNRRLWKAQRVCIAGRIVGTRHAHAQAASFGLHYAPYAEVERKQRHKLCIIPHHDRMPPTAIRCHPHPSSVHKATCASYERGQPVVLCTAIRQV